jgi:hypothetical protein
MTVDDSVSMAIGEGESMVVSKGASEPIDPDPIVPTVGAN